MGEEAGVEVCMCVCVCFGGVEKTSKRKKWGRARRRAEVESCDARSRIDGQRDKTVSVRGARLH